MPERDSEFKFPVDDSLCERCGYPLRGLPIESDCPECGLAVAESSPAKRGWFQKRAWSYSCLYPLIAAGLLLDTKLFFRTMPITGGNVSARFFLFINALFVGLIFAFVWGVFIDGGLFSIDAWLAGFICIVALTYIEMLGVTAFSRRRGWRVPFRLAERVCCYASVGWLPGVLLAGLGVWLLDRFAVGQPWFESLLGLVRVSWLCYGGLFVLSLLWFETLVWIGVRQVRYANAWPGPTGDAQPTVDPQLTDN